jgi:hypothetical protein
VKWLPAIRLKADQRFLWTGVLCVCTGHYTDLYARATVVERVPARTVHGVELEAMEVGDVIALSPDTRVGVEGSLYDEHALPHERSAGQVFA